MKNVYYAGWINYWNSSTYPGTDKRQISGVGWGKDNLEETYQELDYYLDYYANQLGYEIQEFSITKNCKDCNNSGVVYYGKRVRRQKPCPSCKGKPELEIIESWKHWKELQKGRGNG